MNNILLNNWNITADWAADDLSAYLAPGKRAVILPLEYHEDWSMESRTWHQNYNSGHTQSEKMRSRLKAFGIVDVKILNDREDTDLVDSILDSDICILYGNDPVWMMERMEDIGLRDLWSEYEGTLVGIGNGALIQMDTFPDAFEEWHDGLHCVQGFYLDPFFQEEERHLRTAIRVLETSEQNVVALGQNSGMILDHGHFSLLGNAFLFTDNDLDTLYEALGNLD